MKPKFWAILKGMCRAAYIDWRISRHLIPILWGITHNYASLCIWRFFKKNNKIVVIALVEHMGDIVAAEPISRLARKQFPSSQIVWITRKPFIDIVENYPSVNKIITVECLTEWLLLWSLISNKNIVWDLHLSNRVCPFCNIGFQKPGKASEITYKTYFNYGSLLAVNCLSAGLPILNESPILKPTEQATNRVDQLNLPQHFVVIHCKSNDIRRDWNQEKWKELVSWITNERELLVIEIGSEKYIIQINDNLAQSLCGMLSIMETAELIKRSSLFIGIDSGPAHLANAVGALSIILIGSHGPFRKYMPYSGNYADGVRADLIQWDDLPEAIPLDHVVAAATHRLNAL